MRNRFSFRSALVGGLVATLLVSAAPVVASVGDAILAGLTNAVDKQTHLVGDVASQNLKITNSNPGGVAARFVVEPNNAPFAVNSTRKVKKLNADRLDGVHSGGFLKKKDYDADKNGIVDSGEIKVGYDVSTFLLDMGLPAGERLVCFVGPWAFEADTTVVASGGMSVAPFGGVTDAMFTARIVYTPDSGNNWYWLGGAEVAANPPGGTGETAIPLNAANSLSAGEYSFAIMPFGHDHVAGGDFTGSCELTLTAYTGLGDALVVDFGD